MRSKPSMSPTHSASPWTTTTPSRARPLLGDRRDDEDSDSLDDDPTPPQRASGRNTQGRKPSGACVHCKSLKVRCEFSPGEKVCQRCQAGNYECQPRTRKKRKPAPTHEDLQEKAHSQDFRIQSLLQQFDQLKAEHKMKEWIRVASDHSLLPHSKDAGLVIPNRGGCLPDCSPEVAAVTSFAPGHGPSLLAPPDIVKYCSLYPEEINKLFEIYFNKINPYFSLLDSDLHTPAYCIWTCPFLFTAICATASRHYSERPGLYPLATQFARDAAGKALVNGSKSIDVCQAYMILSVYPVPTKKWVEDRSWLFMGLAIRIAIELGLDQPSTTSCDEREALNRTRTWLNCFCADGSHAIQFGKMPMLRLDDYLATNSQSWYHSSPMNLPYDVHLCAYVQLLIIMAKWRVLFDKSKDEELFDIIHACTSTAKSLNDELNLWVGRYAEEYTYKPLLVCAYRGNTTQMITAYLRLVVLAVGFQHSVKTETLSRDSEVFKQSVDAARTVIQITIERLYPTGHLRNAMEANFVYVAFAGAFLLNLLRPLFLSMLDDDTQEDIIISVCQLMKILGSKEVALDGRHTPALYSRFLSSLLEKHNVKLPRRHDSDTSDPKFYPKYGDSREHISPEIFSWPDVRHSTSPSTGDTPETIYSHSNEADMDFSLNHFVRTVTQELPAHSFMTSSWHETWDSRDSATASTWSLPPFHDGWR